ncbi:MAG TPA: BPSS1780 family membrane protein [Usitatibacter sp.]|jgi:uncharacterized membrane protein|nr:BPSS1780 family membrane protein [Usitatibacter sp.]
MDPSFRVATLPATRGVGWLRESFKLFRGAPLQWIGLCSGWISITFALMILPLIGGVLFNVLQPAFFASFAIAAYRQSVGETIAMGDLFSGFRRHWRALAVVGTILFLGEMVVVLVMWMLGLPLAPEGPGPFTVQDYVDMLQGSEWILATGFVLTLVVKGALWFAPPLIVFHGMSVGHAMRWSVYAAVENLGAMMVYGATLLALVFLGLIPYGLGLLVVIPLMAISTFVGYREVFEANDRGLTTVSK